MGKFLTIFTSIFLAIGGFLFGYDSGIIGSTLAQPLFVGYFNNPSAAVQGGVVSVFNGGAIVGSLVVFKLGDWAGRKRTVFIGSVISVFGCALQAGAVNVGMLIAGRFIAGISVGMLSATVPMYCAEVAPSEIRGAMSGLLQWMLSWGYFFAQWIGYGCTFHNTAFQWRFPLAFQVVPGLMLAIGVWFLAESPRWLVEKGRHEEARRVLHKLRYNGSNEEVIELEFREIRDAIEAEKMNSEISWGMIFRKPSWRKRLLLACGIQGWGQLSGINVINYYGPRIYALLGINTQTSLKIIGISGSLSIIECSIGLYLLERFGRVKPMVGSATLMALTLLVNSVLSQYLDPTNFDMQRAMVAMNFCFSLFFTPTGIISWVYPAELSPMVIRAQTNSLATFTNWSIGLVVGQISPIILAKIGFKYFYVFFATNILAALCYWFLYPETKGKTLEQMDELFGDQLVPHALEDPSGAADAEKKLGLDEKKGSHVVENVA